MSGIIQTPPLHTGNPYPAGAFSPDAKVQGGKKGAEKTEPEKAGGTASSYDVVNISQKGGQEAGLSDSVQKMLDELRQLYPDIQFSITQDGGTQSLKELAAAAGEGLHVIISQGFLDRMGSSGEEFFKCSQILSEALSRLNAYPAGGKTGAGVYLDKDKASFWRTAPGQENYQQAINQVGSQSTGLLGLLQSVSQSETPAARLYKASCTKNYDVASIYAKVARANSKEGVRSALSTARRKIVSLQMAASFGEPSDVVKARAAVRSLNKLLARGQRKIKKLDKEQLLSIRKKRAQVREEAKKARQLELERANQRRKRKADDHNIMEEGRRDKRYIDSRGDAYGAGATVVVPSGVSMNIQDIGGMGVGDGAIAPSTVMVTAEVSF